MSINLKTLISKLNDTSRSAATRAAKGTGRRPFRHRDDGGDGHDDDRDRGNERSTDRLLIERLYAAPKGRPAK